MTATGASKLQDTLNYQSNCDGSAPHALPLFVADRELHLLINPKLGWDRFRACIRQAELHGFPPIQKLWGGRYWPKVKAWLDNDNRINDHDIITVAEDGPENFDASPRQNARSQTKSVRSSLLDGTPSDTQHSRFSRPVDSIARGRG
jgi:hypothetical protein